MKVVGVVVKCPWISVLTREQFRNRTLMVSYIGSLNNRDKRANKCVCPAGYPD